MKSYYSKYRNHVNSLCFTHREINQFLYPYPTGIGSDLAIAKSQTSLV